MASLKDVVDRLRADVSAVYAPYIGQAAPAPAIPFAFPANLNPNDWGPRLYPMMTVLDDDAIASNLHQRTSTPDSISIEEIEGEMGDPEAGISDLNPDQNPPPASITISLNGTGNVATLGGTIKAGDVIGVQLNGIGASYLIQGTDSLSSVATALAAAAAGNGISIAASGDTLTSSGPEYPSYAVGTTYTASVVVRYHRRRAKIVLRVDDKLDRDLVGNIIGGYYDPSGLNCWPAMPDGTQATILAVEPSDSMEYIEDRVQLWLRTWTLTVDFAETVAQQFTTVTAVNIGVSGASVFTPSWYTPTPANEL